MTRADILREAISRFPAGKVFGYSELANTQLRHSAMVIEMNRLVQKGEVSRVMRGRFTTAENSKKAVSPQEIISAICNYRNKVCGYETGPSVWEKWGLVPTAKSRKEYYISITQMRPAQKHGRIIVRFKRSKLDPSRYNHEIMQFLDTLESVNSIAQKSKADIFGIMEQLFRSWNEGYRNQLANYALAYKPVTRALAGALLEKEGYAADARRLASSLHPASTYKIKADCSIIQNISDWRIICDKKSSQANKQTKNSKQKNA
ncbi:MAG: hypothetical protein A2W93_00025 [Bacteroidetes bacterium GWF2_43_63]|nr:MAG: hypothetical protein A2W94_07285 [Bacteroidetes bacterium GWE2_42_42]OFY54725.1 MAG: hypothetical protein A2W93_00025 [Bacteroidetes bacterium GWF2_43_63]HBG69199.1 hypothetical protein [Bacteroidales bacterium]HCB62530.1 hypothetical protein [Bacteroidales bacterium]